MTVTQLLGLAAVLLTFGSVLVIRALIEADLDNDEPAPAQSLPRPAHTERRAA
jgi:hypothetical protein